MPKLVYIRREVRFFFTLVPHEGRVVGYGVIAEQWICYNFSIVLLHNAKNRPVLFT